MRQLNNKSTTPEPCLYVALIQHPTIAPLFSSLFDGIRPILRGYGLRFSWHTLYVYIYVYIYIYECVCVYTYIYTYIPVHISLSVYAYM